MRHVHFVDLEDRQRGVAVSGERRHQPGVHVGALGVGGHRTPPASVRSAAAVIRVVVDLPLVPVTMTVRRPVPS